MKKLFLIILFFHMFGCISKCQTVAIDVAKSYGENMRMWSITNNTSYLDNIDKLYNNGTRISDDVVMYLAQKYSQQENETYMMTSYFNWLQKEIDNSGFQFKVDGYEQVSDVVVYGAKKATSQYKYNYVKCDVHISGSQNFNTKDLLYIENKKIVKIAKYETIVDQRTGRKRVKIDLSDIDFDDETWGIMYNYGQHFPLGLSVSYYFPWFGIGVDFGLSDKHGEVTYKTMKMTDIMNYEEIETTLKPKFFITATPSLNLKYIAIGCGVGVLYLDGKERHSLSSFTYSNGTTTSGSNEYESNVEKVKFMLRPSIKGFIPLNDDMYMSLGIGYDCVFGYKKQNGLNFGIGMQFVFD